MEQIALYTAYNNSQYRHRSIVVVGVWLGEDLGFGWDRLARNEGQPTDLKKIIDITHKTGGPVGAHRNNTSWIGGDLYKSKSPV